MPPFDHRQGFGNNPLARWVGRERSDALKELGEVKPHGQPLQPEVPVVRQADLPPLALKPATAGLDLCQMVAQPPVRDSGTPKRLSVGFSYYFSWGAAHIPSCPVGCYRKAVLCVRDLQRSARLDACGPIVQPDQGCGYPALSWSLPAAQGLWVALQVRREAFDRHVATFSDRGQIHRGASRCGHRHPRSVLELWGRWGSTRINMVVAQAHNGGDNGAVGDIEVIGQRIRRERLARSMTQRALAEAVGVGVPHVSKIEAGRENPSDDLLRRIAVVFGCDADEFLLVARRIPEDLMERLAADPRQSLEYLRQWKAPEG